MDVSHSAPGDVRREAVLIPLRSLYGGKGRLADVLDIAERSRLIEEMARTVVSAAQDLDVLIIHDDPEVAVWAVNLAATAYRPQEPGLNHAITVGRNLLREAGYDRVIIAHADLPQASDLRVMSTPHAISIAPDRHRDGTNVLAIPTNLDFEFAYGPGSFGRHVEISRSLGFEPHIVDDPALAWDVDTPDDIREHTEETKHREDS